MRSLPVVYSMSNSLPPPFPTLPQSNDIILLWSAVVCEFECVCVCVHVCVCMCVCVCVC